jgi:hypothetical protein
LRTSAAAMVASKSILGANDRMQLGVIGVGARGTDDMGGFVANRECSVVAVCEVSKRKLAAAAAKMGGNVASYGDYRRAPDHKDKDIDPAFWKPYPNMLAADFVHFMELAKKGHPLQAPMLIGSRGQNQPPEYRAALLAQQRVDLERSFEYARKALDVGLRWRA